MRLRFSIAVAGAHGKTTTTSMIALVLERAGLDPTAVIGGRLSAFGSNARLGRGELMVAEADESDRSFLKLFPTIAVITNIDHEHLENYGGFDDLQQAFVDFANKVPFYGGVVACADDAHLSAVLPRMTRRVTTYGLDADADITASDITLDPFTVRAVVVAARGARVREDAPRHADAERAGPPQPAERARRRGRGARARAALRTHRGRPGRVPRRRAAVRRARRAERHPGVDDYGHHPTEIAAVLAAARTLGRRIVVAFQPHRYTPHGGADGRRSAPRWRAPTTSSSTDIYSAGEDPMPGVTLDALAAAIRRKRARLAGRRAAASRTWSRRSCAPRRPGDVVVTLGAGSIGTVPDRLVQALEQSRGAGA